jgi:FdhD protein
MGRVTVRRRVLKINGVRSGDRVDTLAAEEPLEIRISGRPLTVTMRTPGDDFDLVAGFLAGEGIIAGAHDLTSMRICTDTDESGKPTFNVVDVTPAEGVAGPETWTERAFTTTSACGVCGTSSIEALARRTRYDLTDDDTKVDASVLAGLPGTLRAAQRVFERTGGLHAAGLFDTAGRLVAVREDVGRHNAVDKVTGARLVAGHSPAEAALVVSGRAGFELVQKAVAAGVGSLVAVGAPTSLAVQLAREAGLTLYGFTSAARTVRYT